MRNHSTPRTWGTPPGVMYFQDLPDGAFFQFWPVEGGEPIRRKIRSVFYGYPESGCPDFAHRTSAKALVVPQEATDAQ